MSPNKFQYIIYALLIYEEMFDVAALSPTDKCKSSLSIIVFQICAGEVFSFRDMKSSGTPVRGKRASMFLTEERTEKLVQQCCVKPCPISELLEYCPENW
ncbi:unnamed protein product [Diatraea saccharalis]|uniref:Insulin-like domain-containing protein n=1 Tax=Diatraea saccharalis TaxID=40085 RepID=A0A9N9WJV1_9NEOP|nr:unnamed protein product [Diatraea saccharalis]